MLWPESLWRLSYWGCCCCGSLVERNNHEMVALKSKNLVELQKGLGTLALCAGVGSLRRRNKEQRGKLDIMADILSVARDGAGKTEIVYKTNLNFTRLKGYIAYLEAKGLLEHIGPVYRSTEKGKEFLRDYQKMKEDLRT